MLNPNSRARFAKINFFKAYEEYPDDEISDDQIVDDVPDDIPPYSLLDLFKFLVVDRLNFFSSQSSHTLMDSKWFAKVMKARLGNYTFHIQI